MFKLIRHKNIRNEEENYQDIDEFKHADFKTCGFDENAIGRLVAELKCIEIDFELEDLPALIIEAGDSEFIFGNIDYKNLNELDDENLSSLIEILITKNSKKNAYGPCSSLIQPKLDILIEILAAAIFVDDQTSAQYGGSGLNYFSCGEGKVLVDMHSDQERIRASVLVGGMGKRKAPFAIVIPTQSKSKEKNEQIFRGLFNGENPLPADSWIFHSESGSANGTIMAKYIYLCLKSMVKLKKLRIYDAVSCNDDHKVLHVMEEFDTEGRIVMEHITCIAATPDDRFMWEMKYGCRAANGFRHSNGSKIDIAQAYKGIGEFGKEVKTVEGVIKTLPIKTVFKLFKKNFDAVPETTLYKSNLRCGNYLMTHCPRKSTIHLKSFLQKALVVNGNTIPRPEIKLKSNEEIVKIISEEAERLDGPKFECPAEQCHLKFKTAREQYQHTSSCIHWRNFDPSILEASLKVKAITQNKDAERQSIRKAELKRSKRSKRKKIGKKFICKGCNKTWLNWYSSKPGIFKHISSCKQLTAKMKKDLFYDHPIFKKLR